jgi:AcrR family transcriptional regulator
VPSPSLKEKVLIAARALFLKHGYEAVGMRDIAKAVGKQPVQVYRLNLSKADILAELIIELNQEQIDQLPQLCARITGESLFERTCSFLGELYALDIHYLPIRSVGAAFGWLWSADYEARITRQVMQLVQPVVNDMQQAGLDAIPARCFGIWSLYYVGFRRAVMNGGSAQDCLDDIKPSLGFFLANEARKTSVQKRSKRGTK